MLKHCMLIEMGYEVTKVRLMEWPNLSFGKSAAYPPEIKLKHSLQKKTHTNEDRVHSFIKFCI